MKEKLSRRQLIKNMGVVGSALTLTPISLTPGPQAERKEEPILTIGNITDIHITDGNGAPERFRKCMADIRKHRVDFFLNGGDTIMAADYGDITRERVHQQWDIWKSLQNEFEGYEVFSCLGNHDMWWAAPNKTDPMYGKDYVVQQLDMPKRYYSFTKNSWYFIVLDSNNQNAGSLDEEQRQWLEKELNAMPKGAAVLVMSHYPILAVSCIPYGGSHTDSAYISKLFYKHQDKKIHCISGHMHLLDTAVYNKVHYYCNGSMSGFWWGDGDEQSAGKGWYHETPPGYSILELYSDGSLDNTYYPHSY